MRQRLWQSVAWRVVALVLLPVGGAVATDERDFVWDNGLRQSLFQDRPIVESDQVIVLDAPKRAADPALVPVSVRAQFPQSPRRYIRAVTLLIDQNPVPLAGRFEFTQQSGRADLSLRVRMNAFSPVRAVAELNDGTLHMSQSFVKAAGGCSAPIAGDLQAALSRLGKMKIKVGGMAPAASPLPAQLRISHPNITGLQLDQVKQSYTPALFVQSIDVSFEGRRVFSAETDISISEDPAFGFSFVPPHAGELVATITDSSGKEFSKTYRVDSRGGVAD